MRWSYICLRLSTNETAFAIITGPSLTLEFKDKVDTVDPTRWMNGVAAPVARDQRLLLAHRVALVCAQALDANR